MPDGEHAAPNERQCQLLLRPELGLHGLALCHGQHAGRGQCQELVCHQDLGAVLDHHLHGPALFVLQLEQRTRAGLALPPSAPGLLALILLPARPCNAMHARRRPQFCSVTSFKLSLTVQGAPSLTSGVPVGGMYTTFTFVPDTWYVIRHGQDVVAPRPCSVRAPRTVALTQDDTAKGDGRAARPTRSSSTLTFANAPAAYAGASLQVSGNDQGVLPASGYAVSAVAQGLAFLLPRA